MIRLPWLLVPALLFCLPTPVLANVGTPLMWASMLHLVIGNAVIGLIEGLLIALVFRLPKRACVSTMILANYISAWAGGMPIVWFAESRLHLNINNAWCWMLILVALTYIATLVLEWPFVALCLRRHDRWVPRSLQANLLVQTISYAGLIAWYALASRATLYTDIQVVPASQMQVPASAVVYYIAPDDGDVYQQELPAGPAERVYPLKSSSRDDTLFVRKSKAKPSRWDLFARRDRMDSEPGKDVLVKESFASMAVPWWQRISCWEEGEEEPRFLDHWHGPACRLGDAAGSHWDFQTYFSTGLLGTPKAEGRSIQLVVETPFVEWRSCNATQLPSDQVVFQLGDDQICILDPLLRQVSLIALGQGPVVVLKDLPAASQPVDGQASHGRASAFVCDQP